MAATQRQAIQSIQVGAMTYRHDGHWWERWKALTGNEVPADLHTQNNRHRNQNPHGGDQTHQISPEYRWRIHAGLPCVPHRESWQQRWTNLSNEVAK